MDINQEDKKRVEAVLFTTGKLMTLQEIGDAIGAADYNYVKEVLESLKIDYSARESSLSIQHVDDKYKLNIRKEFGQIANKLIGAAELEGPAIKTLAVIAFKNPTLQSEVIKVRGNKAYDHITLLKEQKLVTAEKHGRTNLLKLTPHFYDYFDTAAQDVKNKFEQLKNEAKVQVQQEAAEKPADQPPEQARIEESQDLNTQKSG
ncbi:MAG: SMC-Scp complex subunit ScpB [Nanoarchaeota archaeon]